MTITWFAEHAELIIMTVFGVFLVMGIIGLIVSNKK